MREFKILSYLSYSFMRFDNYTPLSSKVLK
nr:MAG TPA: hypothetical protein [Caudoviricetes sp.]